MIYYMTVKCNECGYRSLENEKYLSKRESDIKACPKCGSSSLELSSKKI